MVILLIFYYQMLEAKRPAAINVMNLNRMQASPATTQRDFSPSMPLRRRRTKIQRSAKTNQDLIRQSHQMLMGFVNSLDDQVKHLISNHEAQFLIAYRQHSAKVKEQMKEIKKQMLENAHNQEQYLDRIKFLQKQLIIFREETLKMSEKLIAKNDEIENLKIKLKEVLNDNRQQKFQIAELTKTTMTLSVRLKMNDQPMSNNNSICDDKFASPKNQGINDSSNFFDKASPIKLHLKSFTSQMRTRSIKKEQKFIDSKIISSTIEEKPYEAALPRSIQADQFQNQKSNTIKTDLSNDKKRSTLKSKLQRSRAFEIQIQKLKSKSFAERNEYEKIFIECVEEVRKDIMRRAYADSLNYFKQNGPKNLIEFKRLDYFMILQLFLKRESVIQKMFQIIFQSDKK